MCLTGAPAAGFRTPVPSGAARAMVAASNLMPKQIGHQFGQTILGRQLTVNTELRAPQPVHRQSWTRCR
jgi:hypothetical protein